MLSRVTTCLWGNLTAVREMSSKQAYFFVKYDRLPKKPLIIIIIIIITDLYSAFRSEDTEALDAAQED